MVLTSVGVFIDVAVITVAPIALTIAQRAGLSRFAVLLAMIGGVMSPNPNTIAASDAVHVPLTSVMMVGVIPGLVGLALAYILSRRVAHSGSTVTSEEPGGEHSGPNPGFAAAMVAPMAAFSTPPPVRSACR